MLELGKGGRDSAIDSANWLECLIWERGEGIVQLVRVFELGKGGGDSAIEGV